MSYILDALKRADTERERGAVPGLHTRQMTTPTGQAAPRRRRQLWLAIVVALALAGSAGGLWLWQTPVASVRPLAVEPAIAPPAVIAAVAPAPPPTPTPAVITPTPTPAPVLAMPATVPAPAAPAAALPVVSSAAMPLPKPVPVARTVTAPAPPKTQAQPSVATAVPSPATATVPLLSDLSEDLRRQVPALTITGAVYSEIPAQRLLLVNNLVLAQGGLAAPEVKLEEIQARSSVFSFRGTRFRVAH